MELRVVLVRPRYAGNIGAALRAAANFGVAELALVAPVAWMDDPEGAQMAMGAEQRVRLVEHATLADALAGVEVAIATTSARSRDPRAHETPAEIRTRLVANGARSAAVVFGSERSGLSKVDLRACQLLASVPTDPRFPVLNLAQAVAIVLSALTEGSFTLAKPADPLDQVAPREDLAAALAHLDACLRRTGFLDPVNPDRVMDQIRRLVGRALPSGREVAILRGIASHIDYIGGRVPASS